MKRTIVSLLALAAIGVQSVSAAELRFSVGIRETNSAGPIGSNGGAAGGIEWVGRTGGNGLDQTLIPADGNWHQLLIDFNNDPVGGFAGATADGILTSTTGFSVLEHLRIANTADGFTQYKVYIDDVVSTVNGVPTLVTGFESSQDAAFVPGAEVMFQEPGFSGSTSALVQATPNIARVTDAVAFSGTQSYEVEFDFVNDTAAGVGGAGNWVRLTTFNTPLLPNTTIGVPNTSAGAGGTATLSMQIRIIGIPEPASLALVGLAAIGIAGFVRRRN